MMKGGKIVSNIYNIADNYLTVFNMLYDEDVDEQMILDTLEAFKAA